MLEWHASYREATYGRNMPKSHMSAASLLLWQTFLFSRSAWWGHTRGSHRAFQAVSTCREMRLPEHAEWAVVREESRAVQTVPGLRTSMMAVGPGLQQLRAPHGLVPTEAQLLHRYRRIHVLTPFLQLLRGKRHATRASFSYRKDWPSKTRDRESEALLLQYTGRDRVPHQPATCLRPAALRTSATDLELVASSPRPFSCGQAYLHIGLKGAISKICL